MRIFSNRKTIKMFMCPSCHNKTLSDVDRDVYNLMDIENGDIFVCGECADEFEFQYQNYDGSLNLKRLSDIEECTSIEASTKQDDIKSKLLSKIKDVMIQNGFDEDGSASWEEWSRVDIYPFDDERTKIEVGAELSYDAMFNLAEALDPIVEEIDKDAYFDMEDPGIISAIVDKTSIESSSITARYDDEPNYLDPEEEELEVYIKAKMRVDENGDIDFIGDQEWSKSDDGEWESETYPGVYLISDEDLEEQAIYALWTYLPDEPGDYSVTCYMTIPFVISNIRYEGRVGDMETITDEAEVKIDPMGKVEIEGFKFRKLA